MTTSVQVRVNGNYKAKVKQGDKEEVEVGPGENRSFTLEDGANSFTITEEAFDPNARQNQQAGKAGADTDQQERQSRNR